MMRRIRTAAIAAALLGLGLVGSSAVAQSIAGSKHDFSGKNWGSTEICVFCHAPHNTTTTAGGPLWNHALTGASFTPYTSTTMNATATAPAGVSKLCMSCHDGVTAMDSYGTRTGTAVMGAISANLGTNLSNDHPIGFIYDETLVNADKGLNAPASTGLPLYESKLECATCHNVHDKTITGFLRATNVGSGLCLKCHAK